MRTVMLREIRGGDAAFDRFVAALARAELPTDDLFDQPYRYFEHDSSLAWGGFGAGEDALLRSIVVGDEARGGGLGGSIVEGLVQEARAAGIVKLWLLTTNADGFFAKL